MDIPSFPDSICYDEELIILRYRLEDCLSTVYLKRSKHNSEHNCICKAAFGSFL